VSVGPPLRLSRGMPGERLVIIRGYALKLVEGQASSRLDGAGCGFENMWAMYRGCGQISGRSPEGRR